MPITQEKNGIEKCFNSVSDFVKDNLIHASVPKAAKVASIAVLGLALGMGSINDTIAASNTTALQNNEAVSVVMSPTNLPGPIDRDEAKTVELSLETIEVTGKLDSGATYKYWTFNGTVPGPFARVRVGDTVHVTLKNNKNSQMVHNVDFHAVTGPGGGAGATFAGPGQEKDFTFKAMKPGLYVYHCATPVVPQHISKGMYGLILVEPENGLPPVDREFYVMQGEIYTQEKHGSRGELTDDYQALIDELPTYFVFNGASGALMNEAPLKAKVGETIRIYFGVGGPNKTSSFHVIGEIFDKVYNYGSLTSEPVENVQTVTVAPGGATVVDMKLDVPGKFLLVDHALSRAMKGLMGTIEVEGPENPEIFKVGAPLKKDMTAPKP